MKRRPRMRTCNEAGFRRGWWEGFGRPSIPTAHLWTFENDHDRELIRSVCGCSVRRRQHAGPTPMRFDLPCRPCLTCLRVSDRTDALAVWP